VLKMEVAGDRVRVVWARNVYVSGFGIVEDRPAAMEVSGDGHWVYIAIHTVDSANNEFMRWVKMSTIDGSIKMAKGSYSGSTFERPNRKYSSFLSFDNTEWWIPIQRKLTPTNTWTAAIIKLDTNLDVIKYHFI
jgi:hypothetical protein